MFNRLAGLVALVALLGPQSCAADGEVALAVQRQVIALDDANFDTVMAEYDIIFVNFFANWCRFCQMLAPIYVQTAAALSDTPNAALATVDCEAPNTAHIRQRFPVSKYPTLRAYRRNGHALASEYRDQRSVAGIAGYVRNLIQAPVAVVHDDAEIDEHVTKNRRAILAHFASDDHPDLNTYTRVATHLRDDCHFLVQHGSPSAGPNGERVIFKSKHHDSEYAGLLSDEEALTSWAYDVCSPLVREITFENGEELTEQGLPFLIMFYDPALPDTVKQFTRVIKERFSHERGQVNFIVADGSKFSHPLKHLGKTKSDLPVLAFDTFKHMHLFKKFSNIFKPGKLEQFVADLHSGKLHYEFHNPPANPEVDEDDNSEPPMLQKEASVNSATAHVAESAPAAPADAGDAAAPAIVADGSGDIIITDVPEETKMLKDKVEAAKAQKNPVVPPELHKDHEEDDESKPVPVKSVLKHLKPSQNRYSFREEL